MISSTLRCLHVAQAINYEPGWQLICFQGRSFLIRAAAPHMPQWERSWGRGWNCMTAVRAENQLVLWLSGNIRKEEKGSSTEHH